MKNSDKIIMTDEDMAMILCAYIKQKPDKMVICPMIMILLDYYTDDHSEDYLPMNEFLDDAMRKRKLLQVLTEEWRKK